ncbi:MAG: pitrilysin family protein [Thermoguttaceae bacterium]
MKTSTPAYLVAVLFLVGPAWAAEKPAAAPAGPQTPQYTSVRALPDAVTLATLDNGLTVIVQENHVAPVATVRCYVKNTGSAYEAHYLGAGLSHVLEHVVAGGTTSKRSEKEIRQIIETFGGATNAYTSTDMTTFFIDCPARNTMMAIELLADSMQHVTFAPEEFARELKVVRRELADGEVDRSRVLWKMLSETVYSVSPARHPVIGYLEVLDRTTNQAIIDFYHERYVPNNQVFVVVGDVKTAEVLRQVARQWSGTPRGRETYVALPDEPEQISPRESVREMEGPTYDLAIAWPTVKLSHPDLYALDLAAFILGEGESSRLVRRLKYEQQLVLSVSATSETPHFVHGYFVLSASSQPATWKQAAEAMVREVYRLRDELVAPAELAKAKKQKAAELIFQRQTVQQAAESLGHSCLAADDPLFDEEYVKNIQKVTAEEIRAAARRYFLPERTNRVIIAPPGGGPKAAGETASAASGEIRSVRLANGLRVLMKRHANLPLVNVQAFALCGALADAEATAGRAALVAAMLDKGAAERSAAEIARWFDSVGGELSMSAGRFTVYGSATTLREDFPQAAALFADCFTRPAFPAEEYEKVQKLALGAIAERSAEPQAEIAETFSDALPAGTPYHVVAEGKAESVQRLTVEDLRHYHARWFVPQNMVVTVFGDIAPDEAVALVEKHFGRLPAAAGFKPIDFGRDNALPKSIARHKETSKETGMVMLGYPCESIFQKREYAAMTVLETIMAGYGYPGGWLHNELRGEGLVYYVHAFQMTGPVPGYFAILAQTRPDKVDEVVGRIERNIQRAKEGKVPKDEYGTAIRQIVALHAQENTTIAAQARQAALDELYGLGYDYEKTFDRRIEAVSLDEVIAVARKYFQHHVLVTSAPAATGKR